ncbi:MAG: hypothetical protein J5821_02475 [Alphaproteobacteria bacterium]|nr:hypothetical protein [Alphaproteobacteria bacterium]
MNIIGEKQNHQKFSRDDLAVLDKNVTVFSMELLQNCSIFEALKILRYKIKYGTDFYHLYWRNIFKSSPKYLQQIVTRDRWKNYVFIENIIADYLLNRKEIDFTDEWIYAGWHDWAGYRIIVGCGPAIILSRFIPKNIAGELESTKLYLKRLNINSPKIFSTIDEIENAKFLNIDDILNFAEQSNDIKPIFQKKHNLLLCSLRIIIFVLASMVLYNSCKIYNQNYHPENQNNKIKTENFSIYMSSKNYDSLMDLLFNLNDNLNWNKISKFCEQNNIKIQAMKLDSNFAKIKTKLSLRRIKELKNIRNIKIDCANDSSYEKLGSDQIAEAVLWLKLN